MERKTEGNPKKKVGLVISHVSRLSSWPDKPVTEQIYLCIMSLQLLRSRKEARDVRLPPLTYRLPAIFGQSIIALQYQHFDLLGHSFSVAISSHNLPLERVHSTTNDTCNSFLAPPSFVWVIFHNLLLWQ